MTYTQAKALAKKFGMTISKPDRFQDEYRVTPSGWKGEKAENIAYYTNDVDDALATAVSTAKQLGLM